MDLLLSVSPPALVRTPVLATRCTHCTIPKASTLRVVASQLTPPGVVTIHALRGGPPALALTAHPSRRAGQRYICATPTSSPSFILTTSSIPRLYINYFLPAAHTERHPKILSSSDGAGQKKSPIECAGLRGRYGILGITWLVWWLPIAANVKCTRLVVPQHVARSSLIQNAVGRQKALQPSIGNSSDS